MNDDEDLTVDADLLRRVLADPEWTRRTVLAAAKALNTLAFYSDDPVAQRKAFRHPHAEAIPARRMLFDAFITEPQLTASFREENK